MSQKRNNVEEIPLNHSQQQTNKGSSKSYGEKLDCVQNEEIHNRKAKKMKIVKKKKKRSQLK